MKEELDKEFSDCLNASRYSMHDLNVDEDKIIERLIEAEDERMEQRMMAHMREIIKRYTVSICKENGYIQILTKDDDGNIYPCELEFLTKAMIMDSKRNCPASAERIAEFAKMSDEEQGDRLKCAFERGAIHV